MPWGHTQCPVVHGWQSRINSKLVAAGVLGTVTGTMLSVLQQKPFVRHSFGTASSFMICMGGFAVCQELSRLLRCEDSAANSIVAGAASGACLMGLQRGKAASLPAAVVCGAAAGTLHILDDALQPLSACRHWLMEHGLLDTDAQQPSTRKPDITLHQAPSVQTTSQTTQESELTWKERLGIRHLTDEEWAQYELDKREQMQKRLAKAGLNPEDHMVRRPEP